MEHRGAAETAWKSYPQRFALAGSVCIVAGLALVVGAIAWCLRAGQPQLGRLGALYECVSCTSIVLVWLVAPLLGAAAVWGMHRNPVAFSASGPEDETRIRRAARRFSVAAPLFVLIGALPLIQLGPWKGGAVLLGLWWIGVVFLGVLLGRTAHRLAKAGGLGVPRAGIAVAAGVGLILAAGAFDSTDLGAYVVQRVTYGRKTPTFSAGSESLARTVVVPTLDTPFGEGRNVIWCSSFQLAWNEVRDRVIGAPLAVIGAEEVAARLNAAEQSSADLEPESFYAAGGRGEDGIIERIRREMAAKFPSHTLPDFDDYGLGRRDILAYSYLKANVPFKYPYRQLDAGLAFVDSHGVKTQVAGFGLWEAYQPQYGNMREQVEILYCRGSEGRPWELQEYALDLCRHSEPYQVVVAVVEPKGTLAETLEYIRLQAEQFRTRNGYEIARWFPRTDILHVPEMFWRIDHRFHELIGKVIARAEPANPIAEALQTIEFRLDRSGAVLESEAILAEAAVPRCFAFDRPFLVYMKKRGTKHPFFVMWVDNAELLILATERRQ